MGSELNCIIYNVTKMTTLLTDGEPSRFLQQGVSWTAESVLKRVPQLLLTGLRINVGTNMLVHCLLKQDKKVYTFLYFAGIAALNGLTTLPILHYTRY